MNGKEKDQTTRWNNVKGRARGLNDTMGAVTYLRESGSGGGINSMYLCMALCEEMDRMQEEIDFLRERVDRLANLHKTGALKE